MSKNIAKLIGYPLEHSFFFYLELKPERSFEILHRNKSMEITKQPIKIIRSIARSPDGRECSGTIISTFRSIFDIELQPREMSN